jgi:glucan phosphoethanolaminetransferase (alkaline phosphatase superfamily)
VDTLLLVGEESTSEGLDPGRGRGGRALWVVGLVGALVLVLLLASATIPRWWAQRIGHQVDGSITQGTTLGLVYGFVFTFLPLLLILLILRWRRTWKTIVVALALGICFALPNLMTLSIVLGTGNAAHAGDRTLDVEAPAFRGASLVGALVAAGLVAFATYLVVSRDRAHARERRTREAREGESESGEPGTSS